MTTVHCADTRCVNHEAGICRAEALRMDYHSGLRNKPLMLCQGFVDVKAEPEILVKGPGYLLDQEAGTTDESAG